jgi:hypothetical protein
VVVPEVLTFLVHLVCPVDLTFHLDNQTWALGLDDLEAVGRARTPHAEVDLSFPDPGDAHQGDHRDSGMARRGEDDVLPLR